MSRPRLHPSVQWGRGAVAQLVERVVRNDEVRGSTPLGSTTLLRAARFAGQDVQEPNRDASVRYVYLLGSS